MYILMIVLVSHFYIKCISEFRLCHIVRIDHEMMLLEFLKAQTNANQTSHEEATDEK